ncbi:hypothetical protein [Streptomyces sp. NPDC048438]|uniref:hypothetical protein n=1 Tax=Streptomyces sp. NPDC048438 TaxID=3365551 RepID=UPI0037197260
MITVVVTIALAFTGYVATYLSGLRLAQRQERLARLNRQLSDFVGERGHLSSPQVLWGLGGLCGCGCDERDNREGERAEAAPKVLDHSGVLPAAPLLTDTR